MKISASVLKKQAKKEIAASKPSVFLVGGLYVILCYIVNILSGRLVGINADQLTQYMNFISDGNMDYAVEYLSRYAPTPPEWIINGLLQLAVYVVSAGFIIFLLNTLRRAEPCFGNLLDGFSFLFKLLWLSIVQAFFIFLWSLLLIVPGIIAIFKYSQAVYILVDDPDKRAIDCLRESKEMMRGHKWERFCLDLSFIGWEILSALPLVSFWVTPYVGMTMALYYETLRTGSVPADISNMGCIPPWDGQ